MNRECYLCIVLCMVVLSACNDNPTGTTSEGHDPAMYAGGAMTVLMANSHAFSSPAPNLSSQSLITHTIGDRAFEQVFVTAPATVNAGLGPLFNNTSCISCHAGDGRGRPPYPGEEAASMLLRMSIPGMGDNGEPLAVPDFGNQLQTRATFGIQPEGKFSIIYEEKSESMSDGTVVMLQKPRYNLLDTYQPLPAHVRISPRIAPPVFGLGLLESVDEADILRLADEGDRDGDGISGRPNYVWNVLTHSVSLGRFGWKANQPNLLQQTAAAYNGDMGITTTYYPAENCAGQSNCNGVQDAIEVDENTVKATAFYTKTLGVPASRTMNSKQAQRGKVVFTDAGCQHCHVPQLHTSSMAETPELANQTIYPYTDLLLHDMGDGLADGREDFQANGNEWRTSPLWGIGLTQMVNGYTCFLHDGRARTLLEAIMWHGGEGEKAKEYVRQLSATDREALLAFLNSL